MTYTSYAARNLTWKFFLCGLKIEVEGDYSLDMVF